MCADEYAGDSEAQQICNNEMVFRNGGRGGGEVIGQRFCAALLPRLFRKNPRSHHKGATCRVRTGDQLLPVLCHCQLGQDIPDIQGKGFSGQRNEAERGGERRNVQGRKVTSEAERSKRQSFRLVQAALHKQGWCVTLKSKSQCNMVRDPKIKIPE